MKSLKMVIWGEVHGVGFRDSAYWVARKLYVGGFIMNEPDGTVYIEAEGEEAALREFLSWCKRGPVTAKVEHVDAVWGEARGKFTGFRIG